MREILNYVPKHGRVGDFKEVLEKDNLGVDVVVTYVWSDCDGEYVEWQRKTATRDEVELARQRTNWYGTVPPKIDLSYLYPKTEKSSVVARPKNACQKCGETAWTAIPYTTRLRYKRCNGCGNDMGDV